MESRGSTAIAAKKTTPTPKAIIFQKFGDKACYMVEEVKEPTQNGCPGLALPQKGPCLFRCTLQLPDISVVSETFKKKKDAEQSAAEMAIEKLGIRPPTSNPTVQEAWDDLLARISYLFSNEFLSSPHPLSGHFRAALQREGDLFGSVPASIISVCDTKIGNLCKFINPKVETNPYLVISFIMRASARLSESLATSEGQLWIRRRNQYPPEIIKSSVMEKSISPESICLDATYVPCSLESAVEPVTISVSSTGYYLDDIAKILGLADASKVLVTRTIGKASSEMRLYFAAPESNQLDPSSDLSAANEAFHFKGSFNARATYLSGQDVHGDAILASVGYRWKSNDLFREDVSLRTYFRLLMNKIPSGVYKLSRDAILAAELPFVFITRTNWRGFSPREILCTLCRQHRLSEPVFTTLTIPPKVLSEMSESRKILKVRNLDGEAAQHANNVGVNPSERESLESGSTFRCEIKIFSRCQDLIVECSPKESYKKHNDSIQSASLKVLSWLNTYIKELDMPTEKLRSSADSLYIQFYPENFFKEFSLCQSIHSVSHVQNQRDRSQKSSSMMLDSVSDHGVCSLNVEGPDSDVCPSNGSLSCICYSVSLLVESEHMKELLESCEEFEFEIGTGAVIPSIEAIVTQMSVGQSAFFWTDLLPEEQILAAAENSARALSLLSSKSCCLEYSLTLLQVTEPLEDRMEQALFSPPLSKQRVEYAVQHIKESCATSLVDFGCGSGSLLNSLLNYPTSLEEIAGVDISQKSLARAAKVLHSKLSVNSDNNMPCAGIKSLILYYGSITDFDPRLCGFDIGTCLEVIEHMEEDQASLFGDVVLTYFCPRILIVSTPNYEYNVILQKSSVPCQEEDPDEKTQSQACKFRNHDHKFEWTRAQFEKWASDLAARHSYSVEYSGVGGSGDVEPGFASQIAVFRRLQDDYIPKDTDSATRYRVIWQWGGCDASGSAPAE